jgi:hypothetical protein
MNISKVLNLEYRVANFSIIESIINVIDGKSMDESRTYLFASISTFCLFVEMVSNEKEHENNISESMPHFDNSAFLKSNEKERGKGINELMSHFSNHMFSESNEKV